MYIALHAIFRIYYRLRPIHRGISPRTAASWWVGKKNEAAARQSAGLPPPVYERSVDPVPLSEEEDEVEEELEEGVEGEEEAEGGVQEEEEAFGCGW